MALNTEEVERTIEREYDYKIGEEELIFTGTDNDTDEEEDIDSVKIFL